MWILEKDKASHFVAGYLIAFLAFILISSIFAINPFVSLFISTAISALVSFGKEVVWDKIMGKGTLNWKDFEAGCFGDIWFTVTALFFIMVI